MSWLFRPLDSARRPIPLEVERAVAPAKASITMAPADLWLARLAVKTLHKDQHRAIAEAAED